MDEIGNTLKELQTRDTSVIRILLIEDNPGDVRLIKDMLNEVKLSRTEFQSADSLSTGLEHLRNEKIDILLLDLGLPDSKGIETLNRTIDRISGVPIIVLTGLDDELLGVDAIRNGAQDYLIKGKIDSHLLIRMIRYAIERHHLTEKIRSMTLFDELTGLHNRKGFITLAEQQLKIADRTKGKMFLLYADMDGLKLINDMYGHVEGDKALVDTANILKETFRRSDIIARIGGDEFTVFAIETCEAKVLHERLNKNMDSFNASGQRRYTLSISAGVACHEPKKPCLLEEMLKKADELMYEEKTRKKGDI